MRIEGAGLNCARHAGVPERPGQQHHRTVEGGGYRKNRCNRSLHEESPLARRAKAGPCDAALRIFGLFLLTFRDLKLALGKTEKTR
jgi:hypothetical protein